ncbi:MAG: GNAT family N-acetyltransferase [Rhizomicrobium sp.]
MTAIRPKEDRDTALIAAALTEHFGGTMVVSRGRVHDAAGLSGFVAVDDEDRLLGALTWHEAGGEMEIVTLNSFVENRGVGTALIAAAVALGRAIGVRRLWLVTSNDNTHALRFYQKRGWDLYAFHRNAIEQARRIKPAIPLTGEDAIPIRHEIEFEFIIGA